MTLGSEGSDATKAVRRRRGPAVTNAPSHATKKRRAGPEDVEIGRKIRALRLERGLSQSGLADGIDLTFQQVQKYEKGTNRVSAGRLQRIADMLNIPVMFFYGGMGEPCENEGPSATAASPSFRPRGPMRLLRAYSEIGSRTTKYALVVLAESLRNKERG